MSEPALPCVCGHQPDVFSTDETSGEKWHVSCPICALSVPVRPLREDAIREWNTLILTDEDLGDEIQRSLLKQ